MCCTINLKDFLNSGLSDKDAIMNALNSLPATGGTLIIPSGEYQLQVNESTDPNVNTVAVNQGDPGISFQDSIPCIVINRLKFVTIKAFGAKFTCNRSGFIFYRCFNCTFEGGMFEYNNDHIGKESFAIAAIRSVGCNLERLYANGFHRNIISYRNTGGGIFNCYASNANYFNFYSSSVNDVTLDHFDENNIFASNSTTRSKISKCIASGGKSNYFADWSICDSNESYDIPEDETFADGNPLAIAHFMTQYGNVDFVNNYAEEKGNLDNRNYPVGFSVTNTGSNKEIQNVTVRGNVIKGCVKGIVVSGCHDFILNNNIVKDYWYEGIHIYSPNTGDNRSVKNGIVSENTIGDINPLSNKLNTSFSKRAAIHVEKNLDEVLNIMIVNNICSLDDENSYNIFVDGIESSSIRNNIIKGTGEVRVSLTGADLITSDSKQYVDVSHTSSIFEIDDRYSGNLIHAINSELKLPARRAGQIFEFFSNTTGFGDVRFERGEFNSQQNGNIFILPDGSTTPESFKVSAPYNLKFLPLNNLGGWLVIGNYNTIFDKQ